MATACQTIKPPDNIRYFSGKAMIQDKIKGKQDWVNFAVSVADPNYFRIDAYLGLLNIPLGYLIVKGETAGFVNLTEGKVYRTKQGRVALEKLLKTNVSPQDIVALFAEKFPLSPPWVCSSVTATGAQCEQAGVKIVFSMSDEGRNLNISSDKSDIQFIYKEKSSGKNDFQIKEPRGFEVIDI